MVGFWSFGASGGKEKRVGGRDDIARQRGLSMKLLRVTQVH